MAVIVSTPDVLAQWCYYKQIVVMHMYVSAGACAIGAIAAAYAVTSAGHYNRASSSARGTMNDEEVDREILSQRMRDRKRIEQLLSIGAGLLGSLGALMAAGWLTYYKPPKPNVILDQNLLTSLIQRVEAMEKKLAAIQTPPLTITTSSSSEHPLEVQVSGMDVRLARVEAAEAALAASPEKALALPLIRKDIDAVKEAQRIQAEESTRAIDRIYDQNKWFIGLVAGMGVSIVGLAISIFLQTKGRK
jgi:hypothetical protein